MRTPDRESGLIMPVKLISKRCHLVLIDLGGGCTEGGGCRGDGGEVIVVGGAGA